MAKTKTIRKPRTPKKVINQGATTNTLSDAIMGFDPNSIGVQLSQADTMFRNLRWYMISNMRQLLSEMYVEHGLIQTIVDVPVDDALRGGVEIKSSQLDEDDIKKLQDAIQRDDDMNTMGQALKWTRLFGGGGIVIVTDQDPSTPLDIGAITEDSPLEFKAVDMWELYWDQQNTQGFSAKNQDYEYEYYSYYGVKLHKSRVMKLKGLTAPSSVRPRLRGWGFSVVESLVRSLNQYLKANDLTFEILDEFKIDVYKIKGLSSTLMSSNGTQKVKDRIQLANFQKNYQNAVTMDAEDDFIQKELAFTGISETLVGIRMHIASDLRMPLSKIFGISATGFSSGEDDIENYNAMVEGQVRSKCKYYIIQMLQLKCQKLFGFVPKDLEIEFEALRVLSAEQEENCKTQEFNRLLAAKTAGEIDSKDFREGCNKANLLPIHLDIDKVVLNPNQTGEPKADKADDQKSEIPAPPAKVSVTTAPEAKA